MAAADRGARRVKPRRWQAGGASSRRWRCSTTRCARLTGAAGSGSGPGWRRFARGCWAERDVSERIQFAQSAYDRQDYRLAAELAANLHEELPERDDVSRPVAALHERARGAWGRVRDQVAAVEAALAEERTDDALALLGSLRSEHPHNPDWQAIALRVHMDQGRAGLAKGRAAMVEHEFEDAAEAFEAARLFFYVDRLRSSRTTPPQDWNRPRQRRCETRRCPQARPCGTGQRTAGRRATRAGKRAASG